MVARYDIQDKLGAGAMGTVYRAWDRLSRQYVALKRVEISPETLSGSTRSPYQDELVALANEFRTLAGLRHPHIIGVLDYGFDNHDVPFITMSLLDNAKSFVEAARQRPFPEQIRMLIDVLLALDYLHRRGILHRDLKPSNVLVVDGQVKVLDFGLAIMSTAGTGVAGTLAYMAPEVLRHGTAFVQSDLYAVGIMAFELLKGRLPYDPLDLQARLTAAPDLSALKNHLLEGVLARLLLPDPHERYDNAMSLITALCDATDYPLPEETHEIRESYLQTAPFVGRDAELAQLQDALLTAIRGEGSAWLVGGESGAGKSRLLDELRIRALVGGAAVVRGQGVDFGGLSYQLWRDIMPHLILDVELSDLEAGVLKEIVPHIGELIGRDVPDAPALEGEIGQQRLMFSIADIMRRQAQPIVVLLEDLQWTDESLVILKHLLNFVKDHTWLIIGNYRIDERPELTSDLPTMQHISLQRLTDAQISDLSRAMLGDVGAQPQVIDLLKRETEGNVFFMIEVVKTLAEDAGRLINIGRATLPETVFAGGVMDVIRRRLARVPDWAQPMLKQAAIIGRQIDTAVMQQLAQETAYDRWLNACADAAVLEVIEQQWRFAHDKLRETILTDLTADERPPLHRLVASAMENLYANDADYAAQLAAHWYEAGDAQKAVNYTCVAIEELTVMSNFHQAVTLGEQVRALIPDDDAITRIRLLNLIGNAYNGLSDYPPALSHFEESLSLARNQDDKPGLMTALFGIGDIAWRQGKFEVAQSHFEEGLALARELGHQQNSALALRGLGIVQAIQGDNDAANTYFTENLAIMRALGLQKGISDCLNNLGIIAARTSGYEAARTYYEESIAISREIGNRRGLTSSLHNLGRLADSNADYATAQHYFQQSITMSGEIGDQHTQIGSLCDLAFVFLKLDQVDAARLHLYRALRYAWDIGTLPYALEVLVGFAWAFMLTEQTQRSAQLSGLVIHHPATLSESVTLWENWLKPALEQQLGEAAFTAALEQGKAQDFETVVQAILADEG